MADLTPSEIVYLHGERFARERGLTDSIELLHTDKKVRASELSRMLLSTALLANEQAGALRTKVDKKSTWFGLRKVDAVFVEGVQDPPFPAQSLEGQLGVLARAPEGAKDAQSLFYRLLAEDHPQPHHLAIGLVQEGLTARGLLQTEEVRRLKVFRASVLRLPDETQALAKAQGPDEAQRLLEDARRSRPELFALLTKAADAAAKSRVDTSDDGPDID